MAFIVENGSGLTNATSYISVADANAYFLDNRCPDAWTKASDPEKEHALIEGTQYLDVFYMDNWKGRRTSREQSLDWPRAWVEDGDGFSIQSDVLPQQLKDATAEAALRALTEDLMPDLTNPGAVRVSEVKVGPIERKTEYVGGNSPIKRFRRIEFLLGDIIVESGTVERA